jgi:CheY-like chemotaxis protein
LCLRCLIVDDNQDFLAAASRLLDSDELRIVGTASSIAEAVERFEVLRPDVALVDIKLGSESGFELADQLTASPHGAGCSVILISTYAERDFADPIARSPALGFVSKRNLAASVIRELVASAPRGT